MQITTTKQEMKLNQIDQCLSASSGIYWIYLIGFFYARFTQFNSFEHLFFSL